jgi:hypothetical protein
MIQKSTTDHPRFQVDRTPIKSKVGSMERAVELYIKIKPFLMVWSSGTQIFWKPEIDRKLNERRPTFVEFLKVYWPTKLLEEWKVLP